MRATMMLADYAQIADGKLFISGGGWTTCGPGPTPCGVVAIFHVPWDETDQKVNFVLRLLDEDGRGVHQPGATDGSRFTSTGRSRPAPSPACRKAPRSTCRWRSTSYCHCRR